MVSSLSQVFAQQGFEHFIHGQRIRVTGDCLRGVPVIPEAGHARQRLLFSGCSVGFPSGGIIVAKAEGEHKNALFYYMVTFW